jgi:hypothetical protein
MRENLGVTRALSALGVILSLVFVGFEVRQNTMATRGATMQAMSDAQSGLMANLALDEGLVELIARVFEDSTREDFTTAEYIQLNILMQAVVRQLENTYIQHREGLVSEVVFETYGWRDPIYGTPFFAEWWDNLAEQWLSQDFREYFESKVRIGP